MSIMQISPFVWILHIHILHAYVYDPPWLSAVQMFNGTTFIIPVISFDDSHNIVFVKVSQASTWEPIIGTAGAIQLKSFSSRTHIYVFAITRSCLMQIEDRGLQISIKLGSCTAQGKRTGVPLFGRLSNLIAFDVYVSRDEPLFALADSDANLWIADAFHLDQASLPSTLKDILHVSLCVYNANAYILIATKANQIWWLHNVDSRQWNASMLSTLDDNIGCLGSVIIQNYYHAWISSANSTITRITMRLDVHPLQNFTLIQLKSTLAYDISTLYFDLFQGLVSVNLNGGQFIAISDPNGKEIESYLSNNSSCTAQNNWNPCQSGYILYNNLCIPSPRGGYASFSTFYPCPRGTINMQKQAVNAGVCIRCPPSYVALSPVICSACNDSHPLQSEDGTQCLKACPHDQYVHARCSYCQPGHEYDGVKCAPCTGNNYSPYGAKCTACPPDTLSNTDHDACAILLPNDLRTETIQCGSIAKQNMEWVNTLPTLPISKGEPVSLIVFRNSTMLVGTYTTYLYEYTIVDEHRYFEWVQLSAQSFLQYSPQIISHMTLSTDESTVFISDSLTGIILTLSNWNPKNPYQMFDYVYHNPVFRPSTLAHSTNGLFFIDAAQSAVCLLQSNTMHYKCPFIFTSITNHHPFLDNIMAISVYTDSVLVLACKYNISSTTCAIGTQAISLHNRTQWIGIATFNESVQVHTWLVRNWNPRHTIIGVNSALVEIYDTLHAMTDNQAFSPAHVSNWSVVSGALHESDHIDSTRKDARYFKPYALIQAESLLYVIDNTMIRIVYRRGCECSSDHYRWTNGTHAACLKCSHNMFSMIGARACTQCARGFYWNYQVDVPKCSICPLYMWKNDPMYAACRFMQDSASIAVTYTLLEVQKLVNAKKYSDMQLQSSLSLNILNNIESERKDFLHQLDQLGRFWSFTPNDFVQPLDLNNITILSVPGIWIACSQTNVQPSHPCICTHSNFMIGYETIQNQWENNRHIAAHQLRHMFDSTSLFVYRKHVNISHNIPLLIPKNASLPIELHSDYPDSDTGICMIGWPAQYNCSDPSYFWSWPTIEYPGGACLKCPEGKIAYLPSDVTCQNISENNPLCFPGFYKNSSQCLPCPKYFFSDTFAAQQCKPKIRRCQPGHYILETSSRLQNECILCSPCQGIMIPYYATNPCTGLSTSIPYACILSTTSIKGKAFAFQYNVLESTTTTAIISCDRHAHSNYAFKNNFEWTTGVYLDFCYMQCRYDIDVNRLQYYYSIFKTFDSSIQYRWTLQNHTHNLFPIPNPQLLENQQHIKDIFFEICKPCDLSVCPDFMWRPIYSDGCGAPCLLKPDLCEKNSKTGCVYHCDVPVNAIFTTYSATLSKCLWRCKKGWFLNGDNTGCIQCSPEQCMNNTFYLGDDFCYPTSTVNTICIQCPQRINNAFITDQWASRGQCSYTCENEGITSFKNPNPYTSDINPCISCVNQLNRCPPGHRVQCDRNPCAYCPPLLFDLQGKASYITSNGTICRVVCNENYLTIPVMDRSKVLPDQLEIGHEPNDIFCHPCSSRPEFECTSTLACPVDYAIDKEGRVCSKCKDSFEMQCPPGTYASPCPGGRVTQLYCVSCQIYDILVNQFDLVPGSWPARMFIPYKDSVERGFIATGPVKSSDLRSVKCPFACISGSIFFNNSCISCQLLYPKPPSDYPYDTYYALWNASDAVRWWDVKYDPPHLGVRRYDPRNHQLLPDTRFNKCWPCPKGTVHSPADSNSNDPCAFKPLKETQSVSITLDLSKLQTSGFSYVPPTKNWKQEFLQYIQTRNKRRLLSFYRDETYFQNNSDWTQNLRKREQPMIIQNNSLANFTCALGTFRIAPMGYWCATCPHDHFCDGTAVPISCHAIPDQNCVCIQGKSHCHVTATNKFDRKDLITYCMDGYYMADAQRSVCKPCPPGTYEFNDMCFTCPENSYSMRASTRCICTMTNTLFHPKLSHVKCPWAVKQKTCSDLNAEFIVYLGECACKPGTYYNPMRKKCDLCSIGTFASKMGSAACIQCPSDTSTKYMGATSLLQCQ